MATMDSWQTLAVQVRLDKLAVYHAPRGKAPRLLGGDIAVSTTMNTNALRLGVSGQSGFRFDSVSVHARALDAAKSTTYAYNTSNQLTSSVTNSVTTTYTYDAWGRLLTRAAGTASASYAYRGDKLKQVTSTFPNEDSVAMNYDGLGRRRNRMANGVTPITWWRYGLGWDTVAEYTDNDTDWAVEGFSKFNVMTDFMHPLAEATVASGQPPANAAYSYLALDHLSSTRGVFSQTKTQTGTMEFLPYGARHTATGTLPHHQFTAKPYDTGTGLYTFPYRHYSPAMARWTGPDPAGLRNGPSVYGYCGRSPIVLFDHLGLEWLHTVNAQGTPEANAHIIYRDPGCCCDRIKLRQRVKTIGSALYNRVYPSQTKWHLDGGEWYPIQTNSKCTATMTDNPGFKWPWEDGGIQYFITEAWCITDGVESLLSALLWHAVTVPGGSYNVWINFHTWGD